MRIRIMALLAENKGCGGIVSGADTVNEINVA
jgi:hypothetical protein